MNITDFIIGALIANAIPHLIFGQTKTKFLGLFGFSPKGNIYYALIQLVVSIGLALWVYGYEKLLQNGFFIGGLFILITYLVLGKILLKFFNKK